MRHKISIEYIFSSSVKILFARLSTSTGLSEWFADKVDEKGDEFTFTWNDTEQIAKLISLKQNSQIYFKWLDADDEDEYFGFDIDIHPMTEEIALTITDYVDEGEEEDTIELWNTQIDTLKKYIGG